jgi:RNA polymerase sigma-70 factor (ECF subfamily)
MTLTEYQSCLAIARHHARNEADAVDLLQEALLAGIKSGRVEYSMSKDKAWLAGVLRNLAAETARKAGRRKKRESRWAEDAGVEQSGMKDEKPDTDDLLSRLSESTRCIAVLALHGMNPDEICFVLNLKPAAFRQRLVALRRSLGRLPESLRAEAMALAYSRPRRNREEKLDFGLIRRALLHHVRGSSDIGTHDPDGHLVAIRTR